MLNKVRFFVQMYSYVAGVRRGQGDPVDSVGYQRSIDGIFRNLVGVFGGYFKNRCVIIGNIPEKNKH